MKNVKLSLLGILAAMALSACGKLPDAYTGNFSDKTTGAKLEIGGSAGTLLLNTGRQIKADAVDVEFDALLEGKPGIYVRPTVDNANELEIMWIFPRKETRQQVDGVLAWFEAERLYSRMNAKAEGKIQQFKMSHCTDGHVMLDLSKRTIEGGCPAGSIEYDFVRTDK